VTKTWREIKAIVENCWLALFCKDPMLQSRITGTWLAPVTRVSEINFSAYAGQNRWGTKSPHFRGSNMWAINFPTKWFQPCVQLPFCPILLLMIQVPAYVFVKSTVHTNLVLINQYWDYSLRAEIPHLNRINFRRHFSHLNWPWRTMNPCTNFWHWLQSLKSIYHLVSIFINDIQSISCIGLSVNDFNYHFMSLKKLQTKEKYS
jgi:hypothetical protein